MAFSYDVREELAGTPLERECCLRAELAGLLLTDARAESSGLVIRASHALLARRIARVWRSLQEKPLLVFIRRTTRLGGAYEYVLTAPGFTAWAELGLAPRTVGAVIRADGRRSPGVNRRASDTPRLLPLASTLRRRCCARSFLRGALVARGFLNDPARSYRIEIVTGFPEAAQLLAQQMQRFGLEPKLRQRRSGLVVYLQDVEQISSFLGLVGASAAMLELENQRVMREMRGQVNRLVNSETANVGKAVQAALRQQEQIRWLLAQIDPGQLPPALLAVARLRLRHPEASLRELGQLLDPPASKSAVNHRLRRLTRLAESLGYPRGT
ncbi:MAG: DNA-binding protein WhiA [Limnochordales bacterium]|nr:DNA-binding protein WhiA [Limnochordales bacterium]